MFQINAEIVGRKYQLAIMLNTTRTGNLFFRSLYFTHLKSIIGAYNINKQFVRK